MFIYQNVEQIADVYATINCFNPVPAFYDCIKSKNYNAIPPNYYIMTAAMNFSWVVYGLKTQNEVLSTVSLKYSLLFAVFALLSIYFRKEYKKIFTLVTVFAIEYLILNMLDQKYLGTSCTLVQFISDSQQFEPIIQAIKNKNSSYINTKQQVISGISSILWTVIGYKANDPFLIYPNGYNSLLHCILLTLGIYYGSQLNNSTKQVLKNE
ncbi:hypothetical protein ABPG72_009011 [Tetrahymena utriculariae]